MTIHSQRAIPASPAGATPPGAALAVFVRVLRDESGQDIIEYALVASFIGLASVAGIHGIASQISNDMTLVLNGFKHALGE